MPRGETWLKYREVHALEPDEDMIAVWKFGTFSILFQPASLAFTSRGIRIFECGLSTGYSKHRLLLSYRDFPKYKSIGVRSDYGDPRPPHVTT
jgi:hypothetical protein